MNLLKNLSLEQFLEVVIMYGVIRGTKPRHLFDRLLWPTLKRTWEKKSRKNSHWWHWRDYKKCVNAEKTVYMRPDKTATHNVFLGANFQWKEVVVLSLVPTQSHNDYQVGFVDGKTCQLCSLVVNGQVALLLGPRAVHFFAVTRYGEPLELQQVKMTKRRQLNPHIPLL